MESFGMESSVLESAVSMKVFLSPKYFRPKSLAGHSLLHSLWSHSSIPMTSALVDCLSFDSCLQQLDELRKPGQSPAPLISGSHFWTCVSFSQHCPTAAKGFPVLSLPQSLSPLFGTTVAEITWPCLACPAPQPLSLPPVGYPVLSWTRGIRALLIPVKHCKLWLLYSPFSWRCCM